MSIVDRTSPDLCILINDLSGGGAERNIAVLANGLVERGYRVDICVAHGDGPTRRLLDKRVHIVNFNRRCIEACLGDYLAYLRRVRPPRVLATIETATMVACLVRLFSRVPHRLTLRMANTLGRPWGDERWLKYMCWRALARGLYRVAVGIVCVSHGLADETRPLAGPRVPVRVVYNPVLKAVADVRPPKRRESASKPARLLSAGRLDSQKDFSTLLRAFAIVVETVDATLVIAGEGGERAKLETLAKDLGIADRVSFPGFLPDVRAKMADADVFVLSSKYEGIANVLVEALAAGAGAVVSTDCPHGPREVLKGGALGQLVPIGDHEAMAHAILSALNGRVKSPSQAARRAHLQAFSVAQSIDAYEDFLGLRLRV